MTIEDEESDEELVDETAVYHEMCCPKCSRGSTLDVEATVHVRLVSNGTDADLSAKGDHEWGDGSSVACTCGWTGTVKEARAMFAALPEL